MKNRIDIKKKINEIENIFIRGMAAFYEFMSLKYRDMGLHILT